MSVRYLTGGAQAGDPRSAFLTIATVRFPGRRALTTIPLAREDGEWKLATANAVPIAALSGRARSASTPTCRPRAGGVGDYVRRAGDH